MTPFPLRSKLLKFLGVIVLACLPERSPAGELLYEQKISAIPLPIVISTSFDGETIPMLLDTGASAYMVDTSMQSHLHRYLGEKPGIGTDGDFTAKIWKSPRMSVSSWELPAAPVVLFDFVTIRSAIGSDLRGILGRSALEKVAMEINFDEGRMRFFQDYTPPTSTRLFKPKAKTEGMNYIPMDLDQTGDPCVRVDIDGITVRAVIDTGGFSCFQLRQEIFERLEAQGAIEAGPISEDHQNVTADGIVTNRAGKFTRGSVLGVDLKGIPVEACRKLDSIGLPFLLHFNFVYDLPGRRFCFERRHAEPPIATGKMIGAGLIYPEGNCRVHSIEPGPAQDAGLKKDDVILKLGPLKGAELNWRSIYDLCEQSAGQRIDMEYRRAGQKEVHQTQLKLLEKQFEFPPEP